MKLASGTTARAVEEWIGSSPDASIPDRVKVRVFERYQGKCYITGKRLMPGDWDIEHIQSLKAGGQHRESNMAPAWRKPHREKTAAENVENGIINRKKKKHILSKAPSKLKSRGFGQWQQNVKYINADITGDFDT